MRASILFTLWISAFCTVAGAAPVPLTESTITEIIKDVNVVAAESKAVKPAIANEIFRAPDLVRTGSASRVELTAPDHTITRVGSDTVFTFDKAGRNIFLESGSVLFHAPKGQGGGTITSGGASAAVLGTTMICVAMKDGRFKTLDLEGEVKVMVLKTERFVILHAGQMVIVSTNGAGEIGPVEDFNLGKLVKRLQLVYGFADSLSSLPLILEAIELQNQLIADGKVKPAPTFLESGSGLDLIGGGMGTMPDIRWPGMGIPPNYSLNPMSPVKP